MFVKQNGNFLGCFPRFSIIHSVARKADFPPKFTENCYFSENRQIDIIKKMRLDIKSALESFDSIEIACNYLNAALKKLDNLYGTNNPEEKLAFIFKKFCIGK